MLDVDTIFCGDCIDGLKRIADNSVHLAVTSPPYNVGIRYDTYSDDLSYEKYLEWLKRVWQETQRVLVKGGRLAINIAPTSIANFKPVHYDVARDVRDLGFIMRTEILWYKQTMARRTAWGSWKSPSNPHIIPSWEYVMVFCKETWNLQGDKQESDITGDEFKRFSDGYWYIPPETKRNGHPAPFPEELIYRLVKYYTYRGNTVLDMFGGTGTVALVSAKTGRHFIHIDASEEYCNVALKRVDGYLRQQQMFQNSVVDQVRFSHA